MYCDHDEHQLMFAAANVSTASDSLRTFTADLDVPQPVQ